MKASRFGLIVLLALSQVCGAATWMVVYGDSKVAITMDLDSLRRDKSSVKAWVAWYHADPVREKGIPTYQSSKKLYSIDCNERTLAVVQAVFYSDKAMKHVADSTSGIVAPRFSAVPPETIAEAILESACEQKNSSRRSS